MPAQFADQPISTSTLLLHQIKMKATRRVPAGVRQSAEIHQYVDRVTDDLVVELRASVYAQKLAEERQTVMVAVPVESSRPATTWQTFKMAHRSSWWLRRLVRRWPVRQATLNYTRYATAEVVFEGYATFPDMTMAVHDPKLGAPVPVVLFSQGPTEVE